MADTPASSETTHNRRMNLNRPRHQAALFILFGIAMVTVMLVLGALIAYDTGQPLLAVVLLCVAGAVFYGDVKLSTRLAKRTAREMRAETSRRDT